MRPCSTCTSHMTLVKCRASPEGTTTERSVYPLQGVQTQSAGVKEVFLRKTCEGIQKFAFDTPEALQYMWSVSDKYSQKPRVMQVYLQLPRREQYMWPPGQIYAEAGGANLFAAVQALSSPECRKAIDYTAILHLNPAKMQIQALNPLTSNTLQYFRRQ